MWLMISNQFSVVPDPGRLLLSATAERRCLKRTEMEVRNEEDFVREREREKKKKEDNENSEN